MRVRLRKAYKTWTVILQKNISQRSISTLCENLKIIPKD